MPTERQKVVGKLHVDIFMPRVSVKGSLFKAGAYSGGNLQSPVHTYIVFFLAFQTLKEVNKRRYKFRSDLDCYWNIFPSALES